MKFWNRLKRLISKALNDKIAFQMPKPISNEEYQKQRQNEINVLESKYDLKTVDGINSIPVPRTKAQPKNIPSVTGTIEYYLLLKGGEYEKAGNEELAIACYRKANQLMPMSGVVYQREQYMRLPRYLRKLRRFDEARAEEAKINDMFPNGSKISRFDLVACKENLKLNIDYFVRHMHSDLVEVTWSTGCCETCAKYRGRIFSFYGMDKRFPRFPSDFCEKCGLSYFPFVFGFSPTYSKKKGNALIREMNKAFTDTRTAIDFKEREKNLARERAETIQRKNSEDYDWLWEFLPNICPKSLSAYVRMKNARSATYKKIVDEASKYGRIIE